MKKLLQLEYLLPIVYLIVAISILIYQVLVPDTKETFDMFTGSIHIRTSDFVLAILTIPSAGFGYIIEFIFGQNTFNSNSKYSAIMLWTYLGNGRISLTWQFLITPVSYSLLGLLIRKVGDMIRKVPR